MASHRAGWDCEHDAPSRARHSRCPRLRSMAVAADHPRFLIVRRDNIGDLVCTTPLIAALRERHPAAWIGALVNTYNEEVLARNPALDDIFAYEKLKHRSGSLVANLSHRFKLASRLRSMRLDAVLVPSASPQALRVAKGLRPKRTITSTEPMTGSQHAVERAFG